MPILTFSPNTLIKSADVNSNFQQVSLATRLVGGSANQVLKIVAGLPTWATVTGGINYIASNPDAESDTAGWVRFADTAKNIPTDGIGGSPVSTWTRTTTNPLRGTGSFLWTKAGSANRQGEGVAFDFTIDGLADKAKPLALSCDYTIPSGTFTASDGVTPPLNDGTTSVNTGNSDLEFFIYDVTNAALIPVTPQVLTGNGTGSYNFKGIFQTASNSTSYRLIIFTAKTTTNNFAVMFDNFFVGPESVSYGPPVSDWLAYTPVTQGLGTASSVEVQWRRVGDTIQIRGNLTTGTVAASEAQIGLPAGCTSAGITKIPSTRIAGQLARIGNVQYSIIPMLIQPGVTYFNLGNPIAAGTAFGSAGQLTPQNGDSLLNSSEVQSFFAECPIAGLSSTCLMSNDTDTRVVAAIISGDPASASSGDPIIVPTVIYDSHGCYNASTGGYTVSVSGLYKLYGALESGSSATTLTIYKNGSSYALAGNLDSNGEATFIGAVQCVAGDIIDIRPGGTVDASNMTLNIERLSGPSAIAATETISAKYNDSPITLTGSSPITLLYTNRVFDDHRQYDTVTGSYTVAAAGKYSVNASFGVPTSTVFDPNQTMALSIQKNGVKQGEGTFIAQTTFTSSTNVTVAASCLVQCIPADVLTIVLTGSGGGSGLPSTSSSLSEQNFVEIVRVGT